MNTVKEIQAAIPKLSREEIEQIRTWEDHLELTNEVKAKLDQSRREIAAAALQIWSPTFSKAFDSLPAPVRIATISGRARATNSSTSSSTSSPF